MMYTIITNSDYGDQLNILKLKVQSRKSEMVTYVIIMQVRINNYQRLV